MTTMQIDRATVEQALEALEWISHCYVGDDDDAGECASCHERSYKPHAPDCKKNNAITALRAALAQQVKTCAWRDNLDAIYETECGNLHIVNDGTLEENGMKYCCYCGKEIKDESPT